MSCHCKSDNAFACFQATNDVPGECGCACHRGRAHVISAAEARKLQRMTLEIIDEIRKKQALAPKIADWLRGLS